MLGISTVKAGDAIVADDGFDCIDPGPAVVRQDDRGLYVDCRGAIGADGQPEDTAPCRHYLDGQCDDGEHLVGFSAA